MTKSAVAWTALGLVLAMAVACEGPSFHGNFNAASWADDSDGRPLRAVARLDCPEAEGELTRTSAAADGRSCLYRSQDGAEVELRLAALVGGDAAAVLTPLEAELRALVPAPASTPSMTAIADDDTAKVRLPGLSIDADGDRARVRLPGISIDAENDRANIRATGGKDGEVTVHAGDDGAEIRTRNDEHHGVRQSYLLAKDDAGRTGWRAVGYEARGPHGGPLVIAVTKQREDGDAFDDAKQLVERNAGG